MGSHASARTRAADLLGHDPYTVPERPTLANALRSTKRGNLVATRDNAGRAVALAVLADGRRFVMPDVCPHDGGTLSDGHIEANRVICPRHQWEFEVTGGRCTHLPTVCIAARQIPGTTRDS